MAEHTPGPWAICDEPPNDQWHAGSTIFCPDEGTRVADVCVLTSRKTANARLIAAAPDLLEALKGLDVAVNPPDRNGISMDEWNQRLKAATATARAAIAKAT